jgi:pimeloyl-ACP methyl ester carboxylesterase
VSLDVPGYLPAVVWAPAGSSADHKPVVVGTHGAYDSPESYCPFLRSIALDRAFVVCTRGKRISDKEFYFPNHFFVDEEERAAVQALRVRFGARVADGPALYVGFSQGAIHGAPLAQMRPESHPVVVFIEGGGAWSRTLAERYRDGGGRRVLFVCGTVGCLTAVRPAARSLADAGVAVRLEAVLQAGHDYPRALADRVAAQIDWLVEGDPRWR